MFRDNRICPHCGQPLAPPGRRVPHQRYSVERFHSGAGAAVPRATVEEYITPARSANVGSDVVVPLLQSLICGLIAAMVATPIVIVANLEWWFAPLAGGLALAASWMYLLSEHRRSLWQHERYENDIAPAAPAAPRPQPKAVGVKLEVSESPGHMKYAHLPIDIERLSAMARSISGGGKGFALSQWAGSGKLLSRSEFEALRDWLLDADYARWKNDANRNLGIEFTSRGDAFWRGMADGR